MKNYKKLLAGSAIPMFAIVAMSQSALVASAAKQETTTTNTPSVIELTKDPFQGMTDAQIEKLSEAEFNKILKDAGFNPNDFYIEMDDIGGMEHGNNEDYQKWEAELEAMTKGIISEKDWETLTPAQINAKLKAAGKEEIFDKADPFYNMTDAQIEKLSEAEFNKILKDAGFDPKDFSIEMDDIGEMEHGNHEEHQKWEAELEAMTKGIISEKDWETLTPAQINAKLKAAGKKEIFDKADPFYNMTDAQIEKLSEAEFNKILKDAGVNIEEFGDLDDAEFERD